MSNQRKRRAIAHALAAGLLLTGAGRIVRASDAEVLTLHIVPTSASDGRKWIELLRPSSDFQVLVTNVSNKPRNVWGKFSWAWSNLSFVLKTASGGSIKIDRPPTSWHKNYPSPYLIAPSESFVINVNLFDGTWAGNGKPLRSEDWPKSGLLKAVYTIPRDRETKEESVWTGSISTKEEMFSFDVSPDLTQQLERMRNGQR